ncbi:ABC transporter substrate-binding protein [Silanimonas lenta]|uniref:ABC transporter substrate-binding protein n=1 Tax=Silanimonas lenta TaxID=265429 RepID=UPI002FE0548F
MPAARSLRGLLLLLLLAATGGGLLLFGWARAPHPPETLRIGLGPWIGYEPLVLARETGQLPPGVELVELGSTTEVLEALREGRIDGAGLTLDESLRLAGSGTPHAIVAVLSDSRGGDAVLGRPGTGSLAALAGQTVLVEDTAVGQLVLAAAFEIAGVPLSSVTVRRVQSSRLPIAWDRGEAAGVVAFAPILQTLEAQGAEVLFSTRDHPGLVLDVLVLREPERQPPGRLNALMAAWDAGVAGLARADEATVAMLARGMAVSPEEYRAALALVDLHDSRRGRAWLEGHPAPIEGVEDRIVRHLGPGAIGPARPRRYPVAAEPPR